MDIQVDTNSLLIRETCTWERNEFTISGFAYKTECNNEFRGMDWNFDLSKFKFCLYCGKCIVEEGIKE